MQKIEKSLGVIPARGGSKSIRKKNIKMFNGKPLIAWTIEQALSSNLSRVIVTTDSLDIKDVAIGYGAEVPFIRSPALSGDRVAIEPVIVDVLDHLRREELYRPNCVALLQTTSPFRVIEDINQAMRIYASCDVTSVVSVSKAIANQNPHWMLKRGNDGVQLFNGDSLEDIASRRQDLPEVYIRNDYVYLFSPDNLYGRKSGLYGKSVELLVADDDRIDIDINSEVDWRIAEALFATREPSRET